MLTHDEKEFKVVDGEMKVPIKIAAHRITRKIHNPNSASTVMSGIMRSWVVGVPPDSYRTGTKPDKFYWHQTQRVAPLQKCPNVLVNSGGGERGPARVNT